MTREVDYSLLDQPQILQLAFYPRRDWTPPPPGACDYQVPVAENVTLFCRLYLHGLDSPTLLYFHGNGEVASDYDWIAPLYHDLSLNLFVADYRGYGRSNGEPSFATMTVDAVSIFNFFQDWRRTEGFRGPVFVMGRSLGSHSALELSSRFPLDISGLVIESGFAGPSLLLSLIGPFALPHQLADMEEASLERLRSVTIPILVLHGEYDSLISPKQASLIYENVSSVDKRLVIIPGAEHNDIMLVGREIYFPAIRDLIEKQAPSRLT